MPICHAKLPKRNLTDIGIWGNGPIYLLKINYYVIFEIDDLKYICNCYVFLAFNCLYFINATQEDVDDPLTSVARK